MSHRFANGRQLFRGTALVVGAGIGLAVIAIGAGAVGISPGLAVSATMHEGEGSELVSRRDLSVSQLHVDSTRADVERLLGQPTAATDLGEPREGNTALLYANQPIRTRVVLTAGKVSSIALDIVYIDEAALPLPARVIKATMLRDGVTGLLGSPKADRSWNESGRDMEQMTFTLIGEPEFSVFLVDGLVVDVEPGHDKQQGLLSIQLPTAVADAAVSTLAIGLTPVQAARLLGAPQSIITFALKGQPVEDGTYHDGDGNGLITATFIGGVLTAFTRWPAEELGGAG
jgi:hypothetical protein